MKKLSVLFLAFSAISCAEEPTPIEKYYGKGYVVLQEPYKYTLYHNHSEYWQERIRGTVAFEAEDTGNELKFKTEKKNQFNYSETFYMYLILALEKDYKLEVVDNVREI